MVFMMEAAATVGSPAEGRQGNSWQWAPSGGKSPKVPLCSFGVSPAEPQQRAGGRRREGEQGALALAQPFRVCPGLSGALGCLLSCLQRLSSEWEEPHRGATAKPILCNPGK